MVLLRIAWRNLWRHGRRTAITASAIAAGIAFVLPMFALIDGSYASVFDIVVTRSLGHAQIHDPDYPQKRSLWETVGDAPALLADLEALPSVAAASGRLYGPVLLGTEDDALGAMLIGVEPAREDGVTGLAGRMVAGRYLGEAPAREIVLGAQLADRLDVAVGDEVIAVTQAADGSIGNDLYRVVGTYETGSVGLDRGGAYLHLADLQELLVLPGQVHEIAVNAPDREGVEAMAPDVQALAEGRGLLFRRWETLDPQIAQMMDLGGFFGGVFLLMVLAVAGIGVLNTMLMAVLERTRELGVLRALGLRPRQVVRLIALETLCLVAVALAIGLPFGLFFEGWLVFRGLDLTMWIGDYSVAGADLDPVIHGAFRVEGVVLTVVGLVLIALVAAIWPAFRASRLRPVDAMRTE